MWKFLYILCFISAVLQRVYSDAAVAQDSYLNALKNSHQTAEKGNIAREDYDYNPDAHHGYDYHPAPPVQPFYGPPAYGPPKPAYGPPPPFYGPPPHHHHNHHPVQYHPREHWFLDKFKFKLDLFTIGKILLKLIIFKKIVKFIALICLLLFLPKLHGKEDDDIGSDEVDRRNFGDKDNLNVRINEATSFALTAFETFTKKYEGCASGQIWCRFERMIDTVDNKYSYGKIVKLYLPDSDIATNEVDTK